MKATEMRKCFKFDTHIAENCDECIVGVARSIEGVEDGQHGSSDLQGDESVTSQAHHPGSNHLERHV